MSTKRRKRNKREQGGRTSDSQRSAERTNQPRGRRPLLPITIGLAIAIVAITAAAIWSAVGRDGAGQAEAPAVANLGTAVPAGSLPPAPAGLSRPINKIDPMTGKPIELNSPTTLYKGYIVAFCCKSSSAYKGGWSRMTEAEKDAFVRKCLN
jgi:hypothetical protein